MYFSVLNAASLKGLSLDTRTGLRSECGSDTSRGGLAPLGDVRGIQALSAKDRTTLACLGSLVLGQDLRLVVSGKSASSG